MNILEITADLAASNLKAVGQVRGVQVIVARPGAAAEGHAVPSDEDVVRVAVETVVVVVAAVPERQAAAHDFEMDAVRSKGEAPHASVLGRYSSQ